MGRGSLEGSDYYVWVGGGGRTDNPSPTPKGGTLNN